MAGRGRSLSDPSEGTLVRGCRKQSAQLSADGTGQMELEQPSVDRRFERVAEEANEPIDPQCNCDHDCPGVSPCICIAIYENEHGTCQCWCSGGVTEDRRYGLEQKVDLSARAAPLSRIGLVLASKCTADVFVPALDF